MPKLTDCQFIQISIDDKILEGASEEAKYSKWMEGYASPGMNTLSYPDGVSFDPVRMSVLVTKDSSALLTKFLQRGYKKIKITVVHRGTNKFDADYEMQRTVYSDCKIMSLNVEYRDKMFMDVVFVFEDTIETTLNVPNAADDGLDKIGPISYSIPKKKLL
jgi:hypothetical protein